MKKKAIDYLGVNICKNTERIKNSENEIDAMKYKWLMQNHLKMDSNRYDEINRKLSIYDIELGARDIILRLDLDIPLSKFIEPPKINEIVGGARSANGAVEVSVGKNSKGADKLSDAGSQISSSPLGEEENFWKLRTVLDHSWVKKTVAELRYCMEHNANRVLVIGNLGEKSGRIRGENSMRIIQNII